MITLTTAQIVIDYNQMASTLGLPTVKKFENRAVAERRHTLMSAKFEEHNRYSSELAGLLVGVQKQEEEAPAVEVPAVKAKKVRAKKEAAPKATVEPQDKTLPLLVAFLQAGAPKDQKPATTLRAALETFPSATRIQFKHSAIAAGFNGLSARNLFDRVNKAAK